jgi:hypothetical protein
MADLDFWFPSPKSATYLISTLWNWWPAQFQQIENFLLKSVADFKIKILEIVNKTTNQWILFKF